MGYFVSFLDTEMAGVVEIIAHTPVYVFSIVNTMAADDLTIQGAMALVVTAMACFHLSSIGVSAYNAPN